MDWLWMQLNNRLLDCSNITQNKGVKEVGVQKARNIFVDVCYFTPEFSICVRWLSVNVCLYIYTYIHTSMFVLCQARRQIASHSSFETAGKNVNYKSTKISPMMRRFVLWNVYSILFDVWRNLNWTMSTGRDRVATPLF